MELSITGQLFSLLLFSCLGLALGLLYDLLRPPRYFCRSGIVWDILFCSFGTCGFFILSMQRGKPDIWGIAAALLCFCLYVNLLSPLLMPVFLGIFNTLHKVCIFLFQASKKLLFSVKKFFTNVPD